MNEWDELLEHIEEHKDDRVSDSDSAALFDGSIIDTWVKEHPEEYAAYLLQNAWDLRLSKILRDKARESLLSLRYGRQSERMG